MYPRVSPSMLYNCKYANKFKFLLKKLDQKLLCARFDRYNDFNSAKSWDGKIMAAVNSVKKNKIANCAESAILAEVIARTNGIKDCAQLSCLTPDGRKYDHMILYVNDKKPYIIDAWLGFADYVPKAIERYRKEFRVHFDFDRFNTDKMIFKQTHMYSKNQGNFYDQPKEKYQELFPELIFKKLDKKI